MYYRSNEAKEKEDEIDDPRRTTNAHMNANCQWREKEAEEEEEGTRAWTTTTRVPFLFHHRTCLCISLLMGSDRF
jgi:hypothetical protein